MSAPPASPLALIEDATPPDVGSAPLALYAALLDASSLADGAQRLARALAQQWGCDRVSIGLCTSGPLRLVASAPSNAADLPVELRQAIVGAMEEAVDQAITVACPPEGEQPSDDISIEHRSLQRLAGGSIATIPLGQGGHPLGAVCFERRRRSDVPAFAAAELLQLEQLLVLAGPALRWLQRDSESWLRRAGRSAQHTWAALLTPERRERRRLLTLAALAFAFVALAPLQDQVAGRARIEGAVQRVMAAPTDGFIKVAHVRPGDRVKAGAPLVDLLEADLKLEQERWNSQLAQHENAYAAAMAKSDRLAAATSLSRVNEAQAQLALVGEQLVRGHLTAPFDGQIVQGDLTQSIGAPVRQGDSLLTLASTERDRVIVEIDEVDIGRVTAGQRGRLALSSLPWDSDELVVDRIAPMSKASDGRNVFEVEARLAAPREDLRAGLLGRAEITTGRAPLLWSWSRHALLRLRVALWSWLA